jgi:hypothetical protein
VVTVNVPVVIAAMGRAGWNKRQTCRFCHVSSETLASILDGKFPQRLDAWYRLANGLKLGDNALIRQDRKLRLVHAATSNPRT